MSFSRRLRYHLPGILVTLLLVILLALFLFERIFISIKPGEAGVLWKRFDGGTIIDYVFAEGFHVISPLDRMYIYNARVQTIRHEFDVLTTRGLPIHLRIAIRFKPVYEMIGILHQHVGPDYVNVVVVPEVESVLRRNLGKFNPEDIYTNKDGILTNILVTAIEEAGRKYIQIDDIIIRSLELPPDVKKSIENKLVEEQKQKAYEFILAREQQEVIRKQIEASGIKDYQKIISETLDDQLLTWQGIKATLELAGSENAKIVVIGNKSSEGMPLVLGSPGK
jgi:regulator of protease activity HflC (stomatin/prohibitin superfamily)